MTDHFYWKLSWIKGCYIQDDPEKSVAAIRTYTHTHAYSFLFSLKKDESRQKKKASFLQADRLYLETSIQSQPVKEETSTDGGR